jgi:hypothetical protein
METTTTGICGRSPIPVHNLGEETEHDPVHGEILGVRIEIGRCNDGNSNECH